MPRIDSESWLPVSCAGARCRWPDPYEIAAQRLEQIASLIDPSLSAANRRATWRERYGSASRATLYRGPKTYREHGCTTLAGNRHLDDDIVVN